MYLLNPEFGADGQSLSFRTRFTSNYFNESRRRVDERSATRLTVLAANLLLTEVPLRPRPNPSILSPLRVPTTKERIGGIGKALLGDEVQWLIPQLVLRERT